jgi:hypothetical protein
MHPTLSYRRQPVIRYQQRKEIKTTAVEWRREWIVNFCLASVLALLILLLSLSVYLVFSKPAYPTTPETESTDYNGRTYALIKEADSVVLPLDETVMLS